MKSYWITIIICVVLSILLLTICNKSTIEYYTNGEKQHSKIAVITSIYGDYDNLKIHNNVINSNLVDWYCFTDNTKIINSNKKTMWKIITTPYHLINGNDEYKKYKNYYDNVDKKTYNMMSAKYYKIKTHEIDILQKYDYYIWIDGSIFLRDNFINNMLSLINNGHKLINFKHSARNNVKDEVSYSNQIQKYKNQFLKSQFLKYLKDKFPDNIGLFEKTVFVKKNENKINNLFDDWWIENLKFSYQDQISYPYVLWKNNILPDKIINQNVFNNKDYTYVNYNLMNKHF